MDEVLQRAAAARNLPEEVARDLEMSRGIDPDRLRQLPESVLQRLLNRVQYGDLANAREQFRVRQQRDERGLLPVNGVATALAQLDSIRVRSIGSQVAAFPSGGHVGEATALVRPVAAPGPRQPVWQALGPWSAGGRSRLIAPHPTSPSIIWP